MEFTPPVRLAREAAPARLARETAGSKIVLMTPTGSLFGGSFFMLNYVLVALGAGIGGVSRYWASGLIADRYGSSFPWGTLFVNVAGSFIIGVFATMASPGGRWLVDPALRNCFMTGFCGGFTTFSSFSLQTLNLAREEEWLYAGGNAVLSLVLCLLAVWLGHVVAQILNAPRGG